MAVPSSLVSIASGFGEYGVQPPYSPAEAFPEYPFCRGSVTASANSAYRGVREALRLLGLDSENFGSPHWNPLAQVVCPGDTVVLKPNFVREFRETRPGDADCVITHGSIIRAVADYVHIALKGGGRIIIADAPHNDADFDAIRRLCGLTELQEFYRCEAGREIAVLDLRPERARKIDGVIVGHDPLPGDPLGYVKVDLGNDSAFVEINHLCRLLYGSEYDTSEIVRHHSGGVHEYLLSKTVLSADCVISIPKLKTHKKVGLTVNLKNLVGINGNKNWLPHHREGTPAQGGDQFNDNGLKRRLERSTVARFKQVFPMLGPVRAVVARPIKWVGKRVFGDTNTQTVRSGNWYGNDTTWRMCHDLNRVLMYADTKGHLHEGVQRRFFSVVDGIVAGEGNGPLDPSPRPAGLVLAGTNPVAVDMGCARLMGFDARRLPILRRSFDASPRPLVNFAFEDGRAVSNVRRYNGPVHDIPPPADSFEPHFGWKGHVELTSPSAAAGAAMTG